MTSLELDIIGMGMQLREPLFGIACLFRTEANEPALDFYGLGASGETARLDLGGEIETNCGVRLTLSGTSATNSALTIKLI